MAGLAAVGGAEATLVEEGNGLIRSGHACLNRGSRRPVHSPIGGRILVPRITLLAAVFALAACDTGPPVDVAACIQDSALGGRDFFQPFQADYDRFTDSTRVGASSEENLFNDLLKFTVAAGVALLDPPEEHEVGEPSLFVEFTCPGQGVCRPDEVSIELKRVARNRVWSGEGDVIFLLENGVRLRAPILNHRANRGDPRDLHLVESALFRLSWNDFLRVACDGDAAFSYQGIEGSVPSTPLRRVVRAVETGVIEEP